MDKERYKQNRQTDRLRERKSGGKERGRERGGEETQLFDFSSDGRFYLLHLQAQM